MLKDIHHKRLLVEDNNPKTALFQILEMLQFTQINDSPKLTIGTKRLNHRH